MAELGNYIIGFLTISKYPLKEEKAKTPKFSPNYPLFQSRSYGSMSVYDTFSDLLLDSLRFGSMLITLL